MIKLITGLPGHGKSLSAVELLERETTPPKDAPPGWKPRPIFNCGLTGYSSPHVKELDDPHTWQNLPDGSLIVVDEAQRFYPKRPQSAGEPIPPIADLTVHRHRGFDFVFLTQNPKLIDTYVRKLVGEHIHVIRKFGTTTCERVTWGECVDDVQSTSMRGRGISAVWKYDPKLFDKYHSATVHTVKRRIPLRVFAFPLLLLLGLGVLWWYSSHKKVAVPAKVADVQTSKSAPSTKAGSSGPLSSLEKKQITPAEWIAMHQPRIAGVPWSAPIYDGLKPSELPVPYCMDSERHGCTCRTQEGTRFQMAETSCKVIAKDGMFNPYARSLTAPASG